MIVYRLCRRQYKDDLSGKGAELSGGRWNSRGTAALYTAASRALAVLEVAVHVPLGIIPIDYYMCVIELPDNAEQIIINPGGLNKKWNSYPIIRSTQYKGDDLLSENKYLILQVPSAIVQGDFNYIINPLHAQFGKVRITHTEPFTFDERLFK